MGSSSVTIYYLPDEVLCEIFSKLPPEDVLKTVVHVCKRWKSTVNGNVNFWKSLQLAISCKHFFNCSYIKEGLSIAEQKSQGSIPQIFIGEKDLETVKYLQCIKLIGVPAYGSNAQPVPHTIRILDILHKTCKNIVKFEFEKCFGAASKEFVDLLQLWYTNITEIRFGICCSYIIPYKEISTFSSITTLVAHDYAFKRNNLQHLADGCESLSCLWILYSRAPKVDDVLYFLEKKKHVLKELGIGMTIEDCIIEKLKQCHRLEVFFATDARRITDECIKSFNNLPRLKYCSLHRAEFKVETVLDIVNAESPGFCTQLIMLDITFYKYNLYNFLIKGPPRNRVKLVFQNIVDRAVAVPWTTKSPLHWMYRSENILECF